MTLDHVKELECVEKPQTDQQENIREVSEISQDKLPPIPEKSVFKFHHNFYPEPKIDLKYTKILEET